MMTRKDYIKIAKVIKLVDIRISDPTLKITGKQLIPTIAATFADMLEAENPRFNRKKFFDYIIS